MSTTEQILTEVRILSPVERLALTIACHSVVRENKDPLDIQRIFGRFSLNRLLDARRHLQLQALERPEAAEAFGRAIIFLDTQILRQGVPSVPEPADNGLTAYSSPEFGSIRTVRIDGEPWFVGKDVAAALGYKNTKDALSRHVDQEDKLGSRFTTSGQARDMTVINESGLYCLILSSKLPDARKFKRWVTSEVLPSIRRTGSHGAVQPRQDATELIARALLVAQQTMENQAAQLAALTAQNQKLEKKVQNYDLLKRLLLEEP